MDFISANQSLTYQEITRQQQEWQRALYFLSRNREKYRIIGEDFKNHTWVFSGCGTSYYLAQTASLIFEMLTGIKTKAVPASEILIFPDTVFIGSGKYLMVPISRSGTTTEILKAAEKTRTELAIPTLAVSCNPASPLVRESNLAIEFPFQREKSVVMTGSFTTMLLSLVYLGAIIHPRTVLTARLKTLAEDSQTIMKQYEPLIKEIASRPEFENFVFLGQGPFQGLANEAALKIQEMALINSQSYHSLEYRHGPMSTVTDSTLITFITSHAGVQHEAKLIQDLKKLGAVELVLAARDLDMKMPKVDYLIEVPGGYGDVLIPFFYMPLLQLLGFYRAVHRRINPDKPQNLSAVVTLEI